MRTGAGETTDAGNSSVIGPTNASLSQETIYVKDPCAAYINHDAHITNMMVGAMKFLLASLFQSKGIKDSSEQRSKRGGAKIYVIVAEEISSNVSNLNSFSFLFTRNMRKSRNKA